jgi:histidyl-tRNA synthetase
LLAAGGGALPDNVPHVYLVLDGEQGARRGMVFAEELRAVLPDLRLQVNCGGGSFKSQFKRADRSGARFALVIGDDEAAQQQVVIKPLRSDAAQETVLQGDIAGILGERLQLAAAT